MHFCCYGMIFKSRFHFSTIHPCLTVLFYRGQSCYRAFAKNSSVEKELAGEFLEEEHYGEE